MATTRGCTILDPIWKFVTRVLSWLRLAEAREFVPFHDCCVQHDLDYELGGTRKQRLTADLKFFACVVRRGYRKWAKVCYVVVRFGGVHFFRWKRANRLRRGHNKQIQGKTS